MGEKRYKLGLALSGGGMRAFSHLGVLKALEEKGLKPDIIAGTSMGSIVGALFCSGYDPETISKEASQFQKESQKFVQSKFSSESIMSLKGVENYLKQKFKVAKIEELPIPLVIAVTNLDKAEMEYMTKGDLLSAVIASSSIPVIFHPVTIGKYRYVDGGVLVNLPVRPIRDLCEFVIGIDANPIPIGKDYKGFVQIAERSFLLAIRANSSEDRQMCDLFIEPEGLENFGLLNFKQMRKIFELGYTRTLESLKNNPVVNKILG